MDTDVCLSMMSNVSIDPLRNNSNIAALKAFEEIIKTCIGPCGKLKIIQNASGGHITITSASQKLLHIISVQNTILKLIISSTKTHLNCFNNYGLHCSLLTIKLINNSLTSSYPLPLSGKLFEHFGKMFIDFYSEENNYCIMKLDLSSLIHVQCVIKTILQSKPGCILRQEDVKHLSFLLLKAHLNSIPSDISLFYQKNVNLITLEGTSCDKSYLYEGLLIRVFGMPLERFNFQNKENIKIALFCTSLSGDADFPVNNVEIGSNVNIWDSVLKFMHNVIKKIINAKVDVLACQKVVHPSIKKQLENADILVLDRLGYEASKHLEYLSGSSNLSLTDEPVFGVISSINKVTIGQNDFLVLNSSVPFWTLLICNFNEQAVYETKIVCQQVLDTLFRMLKNPTVCFGAGCTEVHTSKLLEQKVLTSIEDIKEEVGCTTTQVLGALQIFLNSITDLATAIHQESHLNFVTEIVYGHLWKLKNGRFPSENDRCMCGQFSAVNINDSEWNFFTKTVSTVSEIGKFHAKNTIEEIEASVILDEASSKINAFAYAFETSSLLLRVSASVHS